MFYDGSGRITRRAEFGTNTTGYTNNGPLPDVDQESPTALPTDSDDPIVSITVYDAEGRVAESIDAEGIRTETRYDAMDRPIASIENSTGTVALSWNATEERWEITSAAPSAEDVDRVTSFVYDGNSNITRRVAHYFQGSAEDAQVTAYGFGPAAAGLQSRDVVVEINYPDDSELDCGVWEPELIGSVLYEYNWLGELTKTTDQRAFVREFERDDVGRITSDTAGGVSFPSCDEMSIGLSAVPFFESGAKIEYVYDEFGRLRLVRSRADCNSGGGVITQRNEIWYGYDALWQLDSMVQNPGRYTGLDATIDSTPDRTKALAKVTTQAVTLFDYDIDAAANYARLTKITYPQAIGGSTPTELVHTYAGHGGVDDAISRPTGLSWFAKNGTRTAAYALIGMDKVAAKTMQSGLNLDYFQTDASPPVGTSGSYAAYDLFGRPTSIRWRTSAGVVADFAYEYSPASDILTRIDKSASGSGDRFQRYAYDDLHRLTQAIRTLPELVGTTPSATPWYSAGSEQWTLDTMGNWDRIAAKPRYDAAPAGYPQSAWPSGAPASFVDPGDYTDRGHDPQSNELAQLDVNEVGTADTRRYHDNAGNLVCVYLSESLRRIYEYDPWNRLTRVKEERNTDSDPPNSPGSWTDYRTIAQHSYYGLHQRATSVYSEDYVSEDVSMSNNYPDVYMVYLYDPQWRLLETRSGDLGNDSMSDWDAFRTCSASAPLTMAANQFPGGLTGTSQYVWGLVYIDELIAYQKDGNPNADPPVDPDGDFQDTADYLRFAIHDRNWSVVGFGGHGVDRRYTPYGDAEPRAMNGSDPFAADMLPGDFNFDGAVTAAEFNLVVGNLGNPGNFLQGDANFDGMVNAADFTIMAGSFGKSWTVRSDAQLFAEATGANGCLIGYCGYVFEPLTELYCVRHRWYEPEQGRWLTRDPAGYNPTSSLYEYAVSSPLEYQDPLGLVPTDWFVGLCRGAKRVARGWGNGILSVCGNDEAAGQCWIIDNLNKRAVETLAFAALGVDDLLLYAVRQRHPEGLPPCVLDALVKKYGTAIGTKLGELGVFTYIKNKAMAGMMPRSRRFVKGYVAPWPVTATCLVYSIYGRLENPDLLRFVQNNPHYLEEDFNEELMLHILDALLDGTVTQLNSELYFGIEFLTEKYCPDDCSEKSTPPPTPPSTPPVRKDPPPVPIRYRPGSPV